MRKENILDVEFNPVINIGDIKIDLGLFSPTTVDEEDNLVWSCEKGKEACSLAFDVLGQLMEQGVPIGYDE